MLRLGPMVVAVMEGMEEEAMVEGLMAEELMVEELMEEGGQCIIHPGINQIKHSV